MQSLNMKEWNLLWVTDYTNRTPSTHYGWKKMSRFNTRKNKKIFIKCAQNKAKIKIMLVCCLPTDPGFFLQPKYFFWFQKKKFPDPFQVKSGFWRFLYPGIICLCRLFNRVRDPNQLTALNLSFQPMSVPLTMICVVKWLRRRKSPNRRCQTSREKVHSS